MKTYKKKYNEALERAKKINCDGAYANQRTVIGMIFPELAESEDEWIRKWLVNYFGSIKETVWLHMDITCEQILAWLEKQKETSEKEYVFRPLAGTDITIAAEQAIRRAMEGDHLVLAFNGWYVPVDKHATVKGLVDSYDTFIEKQKELFESGKGMYYYDGEKTTYCGYPATEENPYDFAMSQQEKQKEQKPVDDTAFEKWLDDWYQGSKEAGGDVVMSESEFKNWSRGIRNMYEQKPVEYGDDIVEDAEEYTSKVDCGEYGVEVTEAYIAGALRERSKKPVEYPAGFYVTFPDGKKYYTKEMRCNNMKIKVVEPKPTEWSEEDENKIESIKGLITTGRFADTSTIQTIWNILDDLRPSWKPSEEQMKLLLNIEGDLRAFQYNDKAKALAELYEQLKRM